MHLLDLGRLNQRRKRFNFGRCGISEYQHVFRERPVTLLNVINLKPDVIDGWERSHLTHRTTKHVQSGVIWEVASNRSEIVISVEEFADCDQSASFLVLRLSKDDSQ